MDSEIEVRNASLPYVGQQTAHVAEGERFRL
jgi:hypothetical protein